MSHKCHADTLVEYTSDGVEQDIKVTDTRISAKVVSYCLLSRPKQRRTVRRQICEASSKKLPMAMARLDARSRAVASSSLCPVTTSQRHEWLPSPSGLLF